MTRWLCASGRARRSTTSRPSNSGVPTIVVNSTQSQFTWPMPLRRHPAPAAASHSSNSGNGASAQRALRSGTLRWNAAIVATIPVSNEAAHSSAVCSSAVRNANTRRSAKRATGQAASAAMTASVASARTIGARNGFTGASCAPRLPIN